MGCWGLNLATYKADTLLAVLYIQSLNLSLHIFIPDLRKGLFLFAKEKQLVVF